MEKGIPEDVWPETAGTHGEHSYTIVRHIFITKDGKVKRVRLDLLWRSDEAIFNYDCDMSSFAAAKAFAKESWSRQFFQDLEKSLMK